MKVIHRWAVVTAAAIVAAGAVVALQPSGAGAHGVAMMPGARTFLCYQDGLRATGEIIPYNPACAAAVASGGTQPLYDWFGVLRSDAGGRTSGYIADGEICGAGTTKYAAYNAARTDWPLTHLTSGATIGFRYSNWAAHPGTFQLYITRDGWSPTTPLAWADLVPFASVTNPPQSGVPGALNYYFWNQQLPTKTGRHILYVQWVRSDSQENFFSCSDVVFDGGNGQVTGVGPNGTQTPPVTSTPPVTTPPVTTPPVTTPPVTTPPVTTSPTPPPTSNGACSAAFRIVNQWNGGFQGEFTVTAGASAINGWTVRWTNGSGQTVSQLWNGVHTATGSQSAAKNATWNGTLAAAGTTTVGFLASTTAAPSVTAVTCTSP